MQQTIVNYDARIRTRDLKLGQVLDAELTYTFLNGPTLASFCLFSYFSNTKFSEKTVGFSMI